MFFIVDLVDRVLDHFAEKKEKEKKDGHIRSFERGPAPRGVDQGSGKVVRAEPEPRKANPHNQ